MTAAAWGGTFPKDWRKVRVKNLIATVTSGVWGDESSDDNGVVCVRAADFDREHLRVSLAKAPLRAIPPEQLHSCALAPGDLILEKSGGGDQQPVGAVVMFDYPVPAVPTNFAARIRPAPDVDARFLCYVFAATYALRLNVRSIKQTTGLQNLDTGSFLAEEWAVPSLADQVCIARFLDHETARIDGALAVSARLLGLLQLRKRAYADSLLASGTYPVARVKSVVHRITSGPRDWAAHFSEEGNPFLRISNISRDGLDVSDVDLMRVALPDTAEAKRTRVDDGDVVVSITADIGSVANVSDQFVGGYVSQHLALLRPNRARIEPKWLALGLFGSSGQAQLDSARYGGTKTQLALADVGDVRLPLPPLNQQRAALQRWSGMELMSERLQTAVELQAALLGERRAALIIAAVSGRIDLTEDVA